MLAFAIVVTQDPKNIYREGAIEWVRNTILFAIGEMESDFHFMAKMVNIKKENRKRNE